MFDFLPNGEGVGADEFCEMKQAILLIVWGFIPLNNFFAAFETIFFHVSFDSLRRNRDRVIVSKGPIPKTREEYPNVLLRCTHHLVGELHVFVLELLIVDGRLKDA